MDEMKIIRNNHNFCNKYVDMNSLPKEFRTGVSMMADVLLKDIATLSLVRTKEHAEWIIEKSKIQKMACELEEALNYWRKRNQELTT